MKAINKKIVITILVILEICSMYLMYKSYNNKNILDSKIETKEKMAIKVIDDNGEYESKSKLPGRGHALNKELTECYDQEGKKEEINLISNGESITITSTKTLYCTLYFDLPEIKEYNYTGDYQVFIAPKTGNYKIELWGASGGNALCSGISFPEDESCGVGGRGAYTKGIIHLTKNDKLYIFVGGQGENSIEGKDSLGGYNGGGLGTWDHEDNETSGCGGGATDIRLNISSSGNWEDFNSLKSRIMVAAAGGGALSADKLFDITLPGTQNSGYAFGKGEDGHGIGHSDGVGGGGSDYYGGMTEDSFEKSAGAGGSSFISGYLGCIAIKEESTEDNVLPKDGCTNGTDDINCSYHYSGKYFTNTEMKAGNELMPTHDGSNTMEGNTGNGYAKITFLNN